MKSSPPASTINGSQRPAWHRGQRGSGMLEHGLVISLVAIIGSVALDSFGRSVDAHFQNASAELQNAGSGNEFRAAASGSGSGLTTYMPEGYVGQQITEGPSCGSPCLMNE